MRVLFVAIEPPWPIIGGTPMRSYNLIARIARTHEVYLACLATVSQAAVLQEHFGSTLAKIITVAPPRRRGMLTRAWGTATSSTPDLAWRNYQPQLAHAIRTALSGIDIDVVHLVGLEATGALMGPDWAPPAARAVVQDEVNAEYLLQERARRVELSVPGHWAGAAYSWAQARKLRRYEARALQSATRVTSVSEQDVAVLRRLAAEASFDVVPNGVDTALYHPAPAPPTGLDVVFSGTMDFRPNVDAMRWFAADVWPRVREGASGARLVIVGRNPTPAVQRLAGDDIVVTGFVEHDLPYLQNASAYVIPIRFGGGSRLKLLQAIACGLPIVSTTLGAEGVAAKAGEQLLIADAPDAFANAILRLFQDRVEAQRLGAAGRLLAADYDWDIVAQRLDAAYQAAVGGNAAS